MARPSTTELLRKPSAVAPMILPVAAFALIVVSVARFGIVQNEDEGAPARLFQLLMLADALAIGYFSVRWIPVAPRPALAILGLQILLGAVPLVIITLLEG